MCRVGGNGTETGTHGNFSAVGSTGVVPACQSEQHPQMRHSAAGINTAILGSERVDTSREAGQLARYRILVKHALRYRAMQFRLRELKRGSRRLLVAGCQS